MSSIFFHNRHQCIAELIRHTRMLSCLRVLSNDGCDYTHSTVFCCFGFFFFFASNEWITIWKQKAWFKMLHKPPAKRTLWQITPALLHPSLTLKCTAKIHIGKHISLLSVFLQFSLPCTALVNPLPSDRTVWIIANHRQASQIIASSQCFLGRFRWEISGKTHFQHDLFLQMFLRLPRSHCT